MGEAREEAVSEAGGVSRPVQQGAGPDGGVEGVPSQRIHYECGGKFWEATLERDGSVSDVRPWSVGSGRGDGAGGGVAEAVDGAAFVNAIRDFVFDDFLEYAEKCGLVPAASDKPVIVEEQT